MKKTENGDKENGGKEQEEFFPRGTIDFLNRELKAVEKSKNKKKLLQKIRPKNIIKRRAKKELDVLFDYLSNNGIVMQKDILKLVGIAITKSIKVKLEKIAKRLDKHEHLDRTKFVNIFTEIFYMKPLLKLITSEHKVEEQISGPVELTSMIQTYLRRQKFKTIHNRFDTGKEERAAERRRIALRKKMAGNMFDAARITKTIRRRNSILDSFEKHKKAQMANPGKDGIEDHEICEVYTWIYDNNGTLEDTSDDIAEMNEIYHGSDGIHRIGVNNSIIYFTTSYGDLMSFDYKQHIDNLKHEIGKNRNEIAFYHNEDVEDEEIENLYKQNHNIAKVKDFAWGRKVQDVCIAENFHSIIVKNRLFTWGQKNVNGCLGHKILPETIDKMTIPEHSDLLHIVKERDFLNHAIFINAKNQYIEKHDELCKYMSMVSEGYENLIEHPWKVQKNWKILLEYFVTAMYEAGPKIVPSLRKIRVKSIRCSGIHSLALSCRGNIYSWGKNIFGSLGLGNTRQISYNEPQLIEALQEYEVHKIECGEKHSIALLLDGKVLTWGTGSFGQLGHGDYEHQPIPKVIESLLDVPISEIYAGLSHTGMMTATGKVFTFGSNWQGQLGRKIAVKQRSLTETLRIAQDKLLRQAANDDGKRDDDDFKFESRSMDPNPIEIRIRSREDKFCSMDLRGNGTLAITRFNHLYVFGETICINHLQKHDKEAQFTGYGRILENEKLQLINWKQLVKEYKLNHGFIHNMNEIYEGSEMDSIDEGESDIRLLNSVLIENGIVLVTATKKKEFRHGYKSSGNGNDNSNKKKK